MGIKNTLSDLNNHLFEQIERLGDEDLEGEKLQSELEKARAVTQVADKIIQNGHLALSAAKFKDDMWNAEGEIPRMLGDGSDS